jgi:3-oxoacyl-[acyl-carrier-protein] synthase-3
MKASLRAVRSHLPERRLTNEMLAREFGDWDSRKISEKTGIETRAIAGEDECASDLGIAAAAKLFDGGVVDRTQIDFLIFCTQSPDYFLPATACLVQERLKLSTTCGAIDINQGCSGFVYGLSLAKGLIESGTSERVLLITAETYSKHIDPTDRSVRTIFGDGACATLIAASPGEAESIGPFVLGTDGKGASQLIVKAGAFRQPRACAVTATSETTIAPTGQQLYMNGPEIMGFTLHTVPKLVADLLQKAALRPQDVDYFIFHQANKFMLEQLQRKLKIPSEKFCINLQHYGNTVSSTIPMALEIALREGRVLPGQRIMLVGFGVGYSWAGAMVRVEEMV